MMNAPNRLSHFHEDYLDDFQPQESEENQIHLMDYINIVLQRLPLALVIAVVIVAAGVLYTWTRSPRYQATAVLLVEPSQINLTDIKGAMDPVASAVSKREFIQTQVELLESRPVIESVIQRMSLLDSPAFGTASDPVAKFRNLINASPRRNTQLIEVSIERENRAEAQQMVNTLITAFIDDVRSRRLGVSEEGLEQLRNKEVSMREKLNAATDALQQFMIENNMVSFERSQNVVMNRLMDLSRQMNNLQPRRMALQAKVEAAENALSEGVPITSLPEIVDAAVIRTLKLELSQMGNEYSQMIERLGENHPNLVAKQTQIQALQTKLVMEAQAILKSVQLQYQQMLEEERLLAEAITEQKQEMYRFNELAAQFDNLQRVKNSIENPYNTIARRIEEIDINRIGGQGENIFIVSKAALPVTPSWPNKPKNLLITLFLAFACSVGTCFFLDYMDTTVKGDGDVRRLLRSKVLASIPNINKKGESKGNLDLVTLQNPRSLTAEAFRTLRSALTFATPGERLSNIVVSSTLPSEGKSLASISISITQGQSGKRTLLIDADMRKPRLHHVFNVNNDSGLSTILAAEGSIEYEPFIHTTDIKNVDFLACGKIPENPAELLESPRFAQLLDKLKHDYEFLVIDSPPAFALVDSMIIARNTDGMLLVIKAFQTPKAAVQQLVTRFRESNVPLLGVVLNAMAAPKTGYYYGGYYHANSKYAKYYHVEES